MPDYLFLMHADEQGSLSAWEPYLARLRAAGHFSGGSAIGGGECVRKAGASTAISAHLTGYLRVQAADLAEAKRLLEGNPLYEAGGTVEIRELPVD